MRGCPGVSVWLEPAFPTGRSWSAAGTHPPAPQSMPQFTGSLVRYPARVSFAAYVVAVLLGGFLLTLPACRQPGRPPVSFVDGAFTATSACCVTGLTVRSTLNDFSFLGQALILALIQLGGLGIMTITTLVSFHIGGQATLHQRAVIAETLGIRSGRDLRWVTLGVLVTVLSAELVGFLLLCWADWGRGPAGSVVWRSLFHAVSAFCNAGFALHDDNLVPDAGRVSINLVICGLLIGTALLLALGAVSFWMLEWGEALERETIGTRLLMGLFHSTTCRTAGFNTVRYVELSSATLFLAIVLMAIGAGPCSTAGGFKVSTFMTLVVSSWANFRGCRHANFFKRTIPAAAVQRATATALFFGAVAIVALVALLVVEARSTVATESRWFLRALFECISALGTVGLSTDLTPQLTDPGKLVLVGLMLLGRLGPITAAVALARERRTYLPRYPEEEPLIG